MSRAIILVSFFYLLYAEESFITQFEYGKMLYENPRGIGCVHCHGPEGQGLDVAQYKTKQGVPKTLRGTPINDLSYEQFAKIVKQGTRIMPKYYLEDSEIRAIHLYLKEMKEYSKSY